ncbi:MAG: UDP-3-O-(3-hydroxymyristoyl)glucosamine N-acyltransferase, partial [Alphaproteobacteria bacterium]|nr:UDP-3-O-(3-hydroxymyristoyl)glucosamine N-acyltransferase [Alphaproteobacteria bacterium]
MADPRFHDRSSVKTLSELAAIAGAELHSEDSADISVEDVAPLAEAEEGQISFLDNIKYKSDFITTKATACIVSEKMVQHAPEGVHLLVSKTPYKSYALVAQAFYPEEFPAAQVSDGAHVHDKATLADGCVIEAGAGLEEGA